LVFNRFGDPNRVGVIEHPILIGSQLSYRIHVRTPVSRASVKIAGTKSE
jgi:hypothetical protein